MSLLSTVHEIHKIGIVHKDIKPDNILIDSNGQVFLADFGLASSVDAPVNGKIVGTFDYFAPEIHLRIANRDKKKCDIWAIGCILMELLTLKPLINLKHEKKTALI